MNQTTLIRLTLAKTFLIKAKNALKQGSDDLSLATAVVDMHDCIDNFLGVLASELQARQSEEDYMLTRFNEVGKVYKQQYGKSIPNRSEVVLLNSMRNSVKHEGLLPNTAQVIGVVRVLTEFCNSVCAEVFGVKMEDISLVSQVKSVEKRRLLEAIEKDIADDKFKEAMEKSALARFQHFDSHASNLSGLIAAISRYGEGGVKKQQNIFPERNVQEIDLKLLQQGIDPYLYYRFGNLVPKIGYNNLEEKECIYEYPSRTWHEKNWTAENANFCLNFLTRLFLGQQRQYDGYNIVNKRVEHKVTFLKDSKVIVGYYGPRQVKIFNKGQELYGLVDGFINGKLLGYREGLPDKIELTQIGGEGSDYQKYMINQSDVGIEISAEEYEDLDY